MLLLRKTKMRSHTNLLKLLLVTTLFGIGALAVVSSVLLQRQNSDPALNAQPQRQDFIQRQNSDSALNAQPQRREFKYTVRVYPQALSNTELTKALDLARTAGINTIDVEVHWASLDQGDSGGSKRSYNWHYLDRLVSAAKARDMRVTFLLTGTPDWVHPYLQETVPDEGNRRWTAPKGATELRHWSNFISDVVGRYKGRVSHFEIWNEPNLDRFWKPYPDVEEYAALLRAAYLSAKDADPDARIVFGGLSMNDLGYLNEYYRIVKASYHDASLHDYFFDVLGVHPYSAEHSPDRYTQDAILQGKYGEVDANFLGFVRMKELMENQDDQGKSLFLSEYGFSTTHTWMNAVPDRRRALYLKRAYELARDVPHVEGLSWFAYHHKPAWAIVDESLDPSLTFRAYRQVTGAEPSTEKVTINLPESVSSTTYSIKPQLTGLQSFDVSRWELYVDGKLVKEQGTTPIDWNTRGTEAGLHEVMIAAYTTEGNVWHSNIAETRLESARKAP